MSLLPLPCIAQGAHDPTLKEGILRLPPISSRGGGGRGVQRGRWGQGGRRHVPGAALRPARRATQPPARDRAGCC